MPHRPAQFHGQRLQLASGASAVICPTTEANLGDGLFPLKAFLDAGGTIGMARVSKAAPDGYTLAVWHIAQATG